MKKKKSINIRGATQLFANYFIVFVFDSVLQIEDYYASLLIAL